MRYENSHNFPIHRRASRKCQCYCHNQRSSNEQESSTAGKADENKANVKQSRNNAVAVNSAHAGNSDGEVNSVNSSAVAAAHNSPPIDAEKVDVILLPITATVFNMAQPQKRADITVFFDGGSHRSYITQKLIEKLSLQPIDGEEQMTVSTFGSGLVHINTTKVQLGVDSVLEGHIPITANSTPGITHPFRTVTLKPEDVARFKRVSEHTLPVKGKYTVPDLLIGSDYYYEFIMQNSELLPSGFHLVQSALGPMITGKGRIASSALVVPNSCAIAVLPGSETEMFWSLENIGIMDESVDNDDELAMRQFKATVKKVDDRYQVKWPIREDHVELPTNYGLALGRLRSTVRRLTEDPAILQRYDEVMKEQLMNGIIEVAPRETETGLVH
jgi:hypothetical protein